MRKARHRHVEIEILQPGAILHGVDHADVRLDPQRRQILDVGRVVRLDRRLVDQEFDLESFAIRELPLGVLDRATGVLQQLRCLAQQGPVLSGAVRHRRHERHAEHLVRHLAAKRLQQLEFFRRRRPFRHHVRILERRMGALVGAVHDGLVGPLEIERLDQRLAHARILELVAAHVHEPALRARRRIVGQDLLLDAAVLDGWKIIARRPYPGGEFLAEQVIPGGEAFEGDIAIPIEFVAHRVEIVEAARDRKIGAPPILDPIEFDVTVGLELADLVRPRSQGDVERRFVERPRRVIGLRKNRQTDDIKRHVARAFFGEGDDQRRVIGRFRLHHVAHLLQDQRMALCLERGQREGGVTRGQFRPVVKPGLRPQGKPVGQLVGGNLH